MVINKGFWYDIRTTLSYNGCFNFIIGNRGCGKTYSTLKFLISQFITKGKKFIYMRRYKTQLDKSLSKLFTKIIANEEFKGHELTNKGYNLYCDGNLMATCVALSIASAQKSIDYSDYNYIWFEEVLEEPDSVYGYLKREVSKLFGFWETVNRDRDGKDTVIVICTANNITWSNPYFLNFRIKKQKNKNIYKAKNGEVIVHEIINPEFTESKKKQRIAKVFEGTEYYDYAINNETLDEDGAFIEKKDQYATNIFNITYEGKVYGVWSRMAVGKMWVSETYNPNNRRNYAITLKDHKPNTMFIKAKNKSFFWKQYSDNYKLGNVYFENQNVKNAMYEVFRMCNIL